MRIITLDASRWTTAKDFYNAVLLAIGAPEWHGRNINAVVELDDLGRNKCLGAALYDPNLGNSLVGQECRQ